MRKPKVPQSTLDQLAVVAAERAKQDAEWGVQDHALERWVCILAKKSGMLAKAVIASNPEACYREAKQVAAVGVAMMEAIRRTRPVADDAIAVDVLVPEIPMPLRLKELADYFAQIYGEAGKGEYMMSAGDRAGAKAVLTAAGGIERAKAWVRWYLHDPWYREHCPTLASMGRQINVVRMKAEAVGGMTDELWRDK